VPGERIINAYTMSRQEGGAVTRISASLATIEIVADGTGSKLTYTEQGAFLDGEDRVELREQGCKEQLEALGRELARPRQAASGATS
jgi:hypothetical protein